MAAILFSVLIIMGGLQVAFSAIRDLTRGHLSAPEESALVAVLLCIVFKEAVFQYQYRYFKKRVTAATRLMPTATGSACIHL